MKRFIRFLSALLVLCTLVSCLGSCDFIKGLVKGDEPPVEDQLPEWQDFASQLKLDLNTSSLKWEVEVKMFIDGDTTHFYINNSGNINGISKTPGIDGVLKARYLGINTPESTGKIEPWGKKASNFTKSKLESAESIIIESDDENWNVDSTGERFLVWVWYKPEGAKDYRNLNLEILQEGLAVSSKSGRYVYGEYCEKRNVTITIPYHFALTQEIMDDFHKHGVKVYPWTVDEPDEMRRMLDMGADGMLTNRVDLLTELK